jgi:hypothetical protein
MTRVSHLRNWLCDDDISPDKEQKRRSRFGENGSPGMDTLGLMCLRPCQPHG